MLRFANRRRGLLAALGLVAVLSLPTGAAGAPIPLSADLSHSLSEGWDVQLCGGFIPSLCVYPTVSHVLTIDFDDGSFASFVALAEAEPGALASIISARMLFVQTAGPHGTLQALRADFTPYSTFSYDLLAALGLPTLFEDLDLTPFEPAHYLYSALMDGQLQQFRFVGDGSLHFTACQVTADGCVSTGTPVPEPATAMLLLAGVAVSGVWQRRRSQAAAGSA